MLKTVLTIASLLSECKDVAEIQRIYHENSDRKTDEEEELLPRLRESVEEMVKIESHSNYPIVVDLTARCIYLNPNSPGCLSVSELAAKPAVDLTEFLSRPYFLTETDCDNDPYDYVVGPIWFDQLDLDWAQRKIDAIQKRQEE